MTPEEMIAAGVKRRYTTVDVPEWGTVRIQSLTMGEYHSMTREFVDPETMKYDEDKDRRLTPATWAAFCVVNADGDRIFDMSHVEQLANVDSATLEPVYVAALKHCQRATVGNSQKTDKGGSP